MMGKTLFLDVRVSCRIRPLTSGLPLAEQIRLQTLSTRLELDLHCLVDAWEAAVMAFLEPCGRLEGKNETTNDSPA